MGDTILSDADLLKLFCIPQDRIYQLHFVALSSFPVDRFTLVQAVFLHARVSL